MKFEQIQASLRNVLLFAFLMLAFECIFSSDQAVQRQVANYKQEQSSFEEQSKHHGRFLISHAPRMHFSLQEQNLKSFFFGFVLTDGLNSFFTSFDLPAPRYFKIIYLFFLKHRLLLYPFHSLW